MSTITSPEIITTLLANRGVYPGDPPIKCMWRYHNVFDGRKAFAIFYEYTDPTNAHCPDPVLLQLDGELTDVGRTELAELGGATAKASSIDSAITAATGKDRLGTIHARKCMTCDAENILPGMFQDATSRHEYNISGMCQECQDQSFD